MQNLPEGLVGGLYGDVDVGLICLGDLRRRVVNSSTKSHRLCSMHMLCMCSTYLGDDFLSGRVDGGEDLARLAGDELVVDEKLKENVSV